jgi:pyruvate formate lyase activating enzyme
MKVNYAGTVPLSTVDWRGRAAITIFFRGCSLRCPYCQNHPYLQGANLVEPDFLKEQINKSKPFVSAVVFSGGEPLMQDAIVPLAEFARELGLLVGIHTNGCYPEMASELVKRKLVDKFFIDIKAPPDDPVLYGKVTGCGDYEAVKKKPEQITASVIEMLEIADSSGLELELRTTLIRNFIGSQQEIASIAVWISEHMKNRELTYVLQQGIPEYSLQENLRKLKVLEREELYELGRIAKSFLENVRIRTKERGEEVISDS